MALNLSHEDDLSFLSSSLLNESSMSMSSQDLTSQKNIFDKNGDEFDPEDPTKPESPQPKPEASQQSLLPTEDPKNHNTNIDIPINEIDLNSSATAATSSSLEADGRARLKMYLRRTQVIYKIFSLVSLLTIFTNIFTQSWVSTISNVCLIFSFISVLETCKQVLKMEYNLENAEKIKKAVRALHCTNVSMIVFQLFLSLSSVYFYLVLSRAASERLMLLKVVSLCMGLGYSCLNLPLFWLLYLFQSTWKSLLELDSMQIGAFGWMF